MKLSEVKKIQRESLALLTKARIVTTKKEANSMEVTDFGLGDVRRYGLQLITYENNDRYCAKELILLPRQTCLEHRHPPVNERNPGKRETFRCRWGIAYLYVAGPPAKKPKAIVPAGARDYFTVWSEIVLRPGEQYTIPQNTLHWFQAGPQGAIVSEFSSTSIDETDIFTNPEVRRIQTHEQ